MRTAINESRKSEGRDKDRKSRQLSASTKNPWIVNGSDAYENERR